MTEQKEIADVVLDTPEPDRFVDCGEPRPLPMFHMHTLMQYGERCAEAALAWLRSQGEPVAYLAPEGYDDDPVPVFLAPQPAIPDGWQLVPKEPTGGMLEAAIAAGWSRIDIYQAMIEAAPEPSK